MKRITILYREHLERGKCNYYNMQYEYIFLVDYTDNKINKKLEELNKNKISRFYEIFKDFNLKTKIGKIEFIKYYLENYNKYYKLKDYKNDILNMIEEWK